MTLPVSEARRNEEVISLAESQVLRWIDEINGKQNVHGRVAEIKKEIHDLRKQENNLHNRRAVRELYRELDELLFVPDYMCLIIDREKDYWQALKGIWINGVRYERLLGTNGGIKNSTIVFVSARVHDEIERRIENGRDKSVPFVTAKLEAYRALVCSASTPVPSPRGILVVPDCETTFLDDIIYLSDENVGEPEMTPIKDYEVHLNASDGYGLILPSLARKWSEALELDYVLGGANTRNAYEKGMVYTFDFLEFCETYADGYVVKDAWGDTVDIRDVDMVLTTSMLKLWQSYSSCEDYLNNCRENGYSFCVTKVCPHSLENERTLNYQFIQSFQLSDEEIEELILPTMNEFKEVLGGDWQKTVLFLKGSGLNEKNVCKLENDAIKGLMIDHDLINDSYVQRMIYNTLKNKINEAKIGVVKVHGNYSTASGDPFALCQSIFSLKITGLLREGEIYNQYWRDIGADEVLCFRAPMSCHNNIRKMKVSRTKEASYWYQWMETCTIFNAWDNTMSACNGMDFDGDSVMLSDNPVLLKSHRELPVLVCAQRSAQKVVATRNDFVQSNIDGFGSEIGQTTNWITSMYDVQSFFPKGSLEYNTLSYRIQCGQTYQQNAIDKTKGIVCKPIPRYWHDWKDANKVVEGADEDKRAFNKRIVADKKPYFMRYIYPSLAKAYNAYVNGTNKNALREFHMTLKELFAIPDEQKTDRQKEFVRYYYLRMPVSNGTSVMNKICKRFEEEFDGFLSRKGDKGFSYDCFKCGAQYLTKQKREIKELYTEYISKQKSLAVFAKYDSVDKEELNGWYQRLNEEFKKECLQVCQNGHALCDILIDVCGSTNSAKKFIWTMCGEELIDSLLQQHSNIIYFPTLDTVGDLEYCGSRYRTEHVELG